MAIRMNDLQKTIPAIIVSHSRCMHHGGTENAEKVRQIGIVAHQTTRTAGRARPTDLHERSRLASGQFPPFPHRASQILAAIAGDGKALEPDGAAVVLLFQEREHAADVKAAAVERLDQAVPVHGVRLAAVGAVDVDHEQVRQRFFQSGVQILFVVQFEEVAEIEAEADVLAINFLD